jgi:hypothetical protein
METVEISIEFQIGDQVFFKADQEKQFLVRGYLVRESGPTSYLIFNLELGEIEVLASELQSYRDVM